MNLVLLHARQDSFKLGETDHQPLCVQVLLVVYAEDLSVLEELLKVGLL